MNESDLSGTALCEDHVRRHDFDRYLCSMLAPQPARQTLMTIYAFNCELAAIRERVNEKILGEIRFQWWKEQIEGIYAGTIKPEGIAGSVFEFVRSHAPDRRHFDDLIDSRIRDLSDELFDDMDDWKSYCAATTVPLFQLSLTTVPENQQDRSSVNDELVRSAAIAWAATGLIRAIPSHSAQNRCMIPRSLLLKYETSQTLVFTEQERATLKRIVREIAETAERNLATSKSQLADIDPALIHVFLPLVLAGFYLNNIRKSDFDPFHTRVSYPNNAARMLKLLYTSWRKRI